MLEQPVGKALVERSGRGPQHAGKLAHHRVDDHHGRQLAARQHVVAQRDRAIRQRIGPLVDALVVAAHEQKVLLARELAG